MTLGALQVEHLAQCMQDVSACSLRFTVYTRDEDGAIVELLNTGMIGLGRFMQQQSSVREAHEVVLDFEDDVRMTMKFARAFLGHEHRRAAGFRGLRLMILLLAMLVLSFL